MKNYEVIVETRELHRFDVSGDDENKAIVEALSLLDSDIPLSNSNISYNVMDIILKDEYLM